MGSRRRLASIWRGREDCKGERRLVVDVTLPADKWGEAS